MVRYNSTHHGHPSRVGNCFVASDYRILHDPSLTDGPSLTGTQVEIRWLLYSNEIAHTKSIHSMKSMLSHLYLKLTNISQSIIPPSQSWVELREKHKNHSHSFDP